MRYGFMPVKTVFSKKAGCVQAYILLWHKKRSGRTLQSIRCCSCQPCHLFHHNMKSNYQQHSPFLAKYQLKLDGMSLTPCVCIGVVFISVLVFMHVNNCVCVKILNRGMLQLQIIATCGFFDCLIIYCAIHLGFSGGKKSH